MTAPGRPTTEELELIRDMLVLPNLVIMLERQRQEMEYNSIMLKPLYLRAVDALIYKINRDFSQLRQELRRRKIKTWEGDHTEFIMYIDFVCRGYKDRLGVVREVLKSVIRERLTQYVNEMGAALYSHVSERDQGPKRSAISEASYEEQPAGG